MAMLKEVVMPGGPCADGRSATEIEGTTLVFKIVASTPIPPGVFRREAILVTSRTVQLALVNILKLIGDLVDTDLPRRMRT